MNRKIGLVATAVMGSAVVVFLVCLCVALVAPNAVTENLSYGVCAVLSWAWVATACVYACYARPEHAAAAKIGIAMGAIYATLINLVYFTQLTTVLHGSVDAGLMQAFSFAAAGSWLFNIDLLGYGLLALSTFFVGLAVRAETKCDKVLRALLLLHGAFFVCMFVPVLPLPATNQGNGGTIALMGWCLFFLPICILSALYFSKRAE